MDREMTKITKELISRGHIRGTGNLIRFKPSYDYRTWTSPTTAITG